MDAVRTAADRGRRAHRTCPTKAVASSYWRPHGLARSRSGGDETSRDGRRSRKSHGRERSQTRGSGNGGFARHASCAPTGCRARARFRTGRIADRRRAHLDRSATSVPRRLDGPARCRAESERCSRRGSRSGAPGRGVAGSSRGVRAGAARFDQLVGSVAGGCAGCVRPSVRQSSGS